MNNFMWLNDLIDAGKILIVNGGIHLNDNSKKIGDIFGNTFGDNVNLQGDHVTQTKIVNSGEFNSAFDDLMKDITKIPDEMQKQQAEFFAEQLKQAYETKNTSQGQKLLGFLKGSLGTVASLTTIARFFGIGV
jgi:hypothetical protein